MPLQYIPLMLTDLKERSSIKNCILHGQGFHETLIPMLWLVRSLWLALE